MQLVMRPQHAIKARLGGAAPAPPICHSRGTIWARAAFRAIRRHSPPRSAGADRRGRRDHQCELVAPTPRLRVPRTRRHRFTAVLELTAPGSQVGLRNPGLPVPLGHPAGTRRPHLLDNLGFELIAVPRHSIRSLHPTAGEIYPARSSGLLCRQAGYASGFARSPEEDASS